MAAQERCIQVALHRAYATGAVVPALRERLLLVAAAAVAVLGQSGRDRGYFMQDAASSCNRASQLLEKHPRRMSAYALSILLLPGAVRQVFGNDGRAARHHLVDEPSVQTLAMRGQLAFLGGQPLAGRQVALAVLPGEPPLANPPVLVVVLRVVGAALPVEFTLQTALLLLIGFEFRTEGEQARLSLLRHDGDGRGTKVETECTRSDSVPGFLVG